jgi:putative flippase GtrA
MSEYSVINKIKNHPIVQNRPWLPQFIKFSVVGVSGTIIDYGVLNLLVLVFHTNVYLSSTVSFTLAVVNNFIWNKYWTFKVNNQTNRPYFQFFQFLVVSVVGLGLNLLIMYILIHFFNIWYNLAKAFAIVVVLFWNFIANKLWNFKVKNKSF